MKRRRSLQEILDSTVRQRLTALCCGEATTTWFTQLSQAAAQRPRNRQRSVRHIALIIPLRVPTSESEQSNQHGEASSRGRRFPDHRMQQCWDAPVSKETELSLRIRFAEV